jgi:glutamine amidotransferase
LPGVGAFGDCYRGLASSEGMIAALDEAVLQKGRPFIGICVGMQLLAERGLEHGTHRGLGFIKGQVEAIKPADPALKIPHMGWNTLKVQRQHPLLEGIAPEWHAYFVHSYAFKTENPEDCAAVTDYGGEIAALVTRDNIAGSQFHPEKSQKLGLQLIANFLKWRP